MRKLLSLAAMLAVAICAAQPRQALTLRMRSGASIVYYLDTQPEIGFIGQTMVVTESGKATDISMQDVHHWEIGLVDPSGIEDAVGPDAVSMKVYGNTLTITNPDLEKIAVCNAAGLIIYAGHESEVSLTLPQGVYLIRVASKTYKIAIR